MSGQRAPPPATGNGLLRGSRARSYGSLVRSPLSPLSPHSALSPFCRRHIEHRLQPGETLQGLALKYGVSMEQIKRANRLYTNDSIFLKKSLSIPVLSDADDSNGASLGEDDSEDCAPDKNGLMSNSSDAKQDSGTERASDLTPKDFLKRLDVLISQSKQAAAKGCQEAEKRVADLEAACNSRTSEWRPLTRSQSLISSSRMQQQDLPLTITKLTKKLREREDEIFEL